MSLNVPGPGLLGEAILPVMRFLSLEKGDDATVSPCTYDDQLKLYFQRIL